MNNELTGLSDEQLRILRNTCREMLRAVAQSLGDRPDLSEAVRRNNVGSGHAESVPGDC